MSRLKILFEMVIQRKDLQMKDRMQGNKKNQLYMSIKSFKVQSHQTVTKTRNWKTEKRKSESLVTTTYF